MEHKKFHHKDEWRGQTPTSQDMGKPRRPAAASRHFKNILFEALYSNELRIPPEDGVRNTDSPVSGNENARIHGVDSPDLPRKKPQSLPWCSKSHCWAPYAEIYLTGDLSPTEKNVPRSIPLTLEVSPQPTYNENPPFWRSGRPIHDRSPKREKHGPAHSKKAAIKDPGKELSQFSNPPSEAEKRTPTTNYDQNRFEHTESPYPNIGKGISSMKRESSSKQDVFGGKLPAKTLTSCENMDPVPGSPKRSTTELKPQFRLSGENIEESSARISPSVSPYRNQESIYDETPKSKPNALTNPTPRVTGAYIETPLPLPPSTKSDNLICQEKSKIESEKKSAKASIAGIPNRVTLSGQLKCIKEEEGIKDDTDFDQFLEGMENSTASSNLGFGRNNPSFRTDQIFDENFFQNILKNLNDTADKVEKVDQSLKRLGHPMYNSGMPRADEDYAQCNGKITKRIPRLLVTLIPSRPEEPIRIFRNRNWKFTWLGLVIFVVGLWSSAEMAMCTVFCHPKYASKNTWHPSDPFFPWAIPTKLDQWTGQIGSGTLDQILDWIDPQRHKKRLRPQHLYSGYDWWGGKDGPASTPFLSTAAATGETGSIDDDELWI